ncbi:heme lyase CcmF/NrfE family subunit, partial [Acidobacteria bacterium AH-259-O06]|nr:heme lyase CcmF/NrfE family subunit [Acidobacteria bacterium AH-259-O06]
MIELGRYCLIASLLFCTYGIVAALVGGVRNHLPLVRSAENSVIAHFVILMVASLCLWYLLLTDEFLVEYVAGYSAADIPTAYKFTAFWGGQKGSLLLWALVLSLFSFIVVIQNRSRNRDLMPYTTAVLLGTLVFFMVLLNFATNPFDTLDFRPADGQGLNPLLQNLYMIIHPPCLFLGYVGLTVPFAFAMGALMSGRLDTSWIRTTRRWTLVAWIFLTFGVTLGGAWAYEELGWGGYWAWDPVENASFMPWLIATAFLHSVMITEKKGMLKMWNFVLILAAFELTIFGTFITRSGVISSVHSFALSGIGPLFVIFLAISTFFGLFWIFYRSSELRSEQRMRSFLSREASFLLNNLLFVSICFAIFWGTVFPILSEWVTGEKITVSTPFFNQVNLPLGLALLILTGICPLIAWRKASGKNFLRNFPIPLLVGVVSGGVVLLIGVRDLIPLIFFSACGFVAMTMVYEFYKGARARKSIRPTGFLIALRDLTLMNKRRYGGFIIHVGVVFVFVGIIASSFFNVEQVFTVKKGERFTVADYTLVFQELTQRRDPEKEVVTARIDVLRGGKKIAGLTPEKHFHHKGEQPMTEVKIRSTLKEDLYLVLSGWDEQGQVTFRVFVNPLVQAIWIGIGIMVIGGIFVLFPDRKPGP